MLPDFVANNILDQNLPLDAPQGIETYKQRQRYHAELLQQPKIVTIAPMFHNLAVGNPPLPLHKCQGRPGGNG